VIKGVKEDVKLSVPAGDTELLQSGPVEIGFILTPDIDEFPVPCVTIGRGGIGVKPVLEGIDHRDPGKSGDDLVEMLPIGLGVLLAGVDVALLQMSPSDVF